MADSAPTDLAKLLARLDALEKQVARIPVLEAEIARKDKIIAGLQQRLFGSSSEKLDPAQLQLLFDEIVLGKPAPPPDQSGESSAPGEEKPSAARTRRSKAEIFPANLKVVTERVLIPDEVLNNPGDWDDGGEEHHDELDVIKAEIFWRRTIRKKFVHKTDKSRPPIIAAAPLPSIPGTLIAPALAAHIRRKFTDLGDASPEVVVPILLHIQRIYFIEKQIRQTAAPPACRELIRRARSRPIADKLHRFILEQRQIHRPAGDVGQALGYTINQWPKFLVCLEDGALELDTNLVENMIRPTTLGMKNWLFFGSLEAGANNALIYTLLANCRVQGLDPEDYLVEVLTRLPHEATLEQAAALTPARIAAERRAAPGAQQVA